MSSVMDRISACGIVPVINLKSADQAVPLGRALLAGGIDVMEITFRSDAACASIQKVCEELPEVLAGAGTVTTCEQIDMAIAAGAKFIVSPGLSVKLVEYAQKKNIPILPGTVTPSEILTGLELGLDTFKFFPAGQYGGIKTMKALSAPYGSIKFLPTGGVNASNLAEYLAFDKIIAVGGSWMVDKKLVDAGEFDTITAMTKEATDIFHSVRG